jgi:hypothetical protein
MGYGHTSRAHKAPFSAGATLIAAWATALIIIIAVVMAPSRRAADDAALARALAGSPTVMFHELSQAVAASTALATAASLGPIAATAMSARASRSMSSPGVDRLERPFPTTDQVVAGLWRQPVPTPPSYREAALDDTVELYTFLRTATSYEAAIPTLFPVASSFTSDSSLPHQVAVHGSSRSISYSSARHPLILSRQPTLTLSTHPATPTTIRQAGTANPTVPAHAASRRFSFPFRIAAHPIPCIS